MAEDVLQRAIRRTGGLSGWQEGTAICGRQAKRGRHEAEHHVPRRPQGGGAFGCLLWAQKSLGRAPGGERLERLNHIPSTLPGFDEGGVTTTTSGRNMFE